MLVRCQLPGRFGLGDSGLRSKCMVQCVKMRNRGSPDSELNGWDWEGKKAGWHTKSLALAHTAAKPSRKRIRMVTARGAHVHLSNPGHRLQYGKAVLLGMLDWQTHAHPTHKPMESSLNGLGDTT